MKSRLGGLQATIERRIGKFDGAVVALSGGVDSSLVAALAVRALADRALAVTSSSPALATGELEAAKNVARALGIAHETIYSTELSREEYRRNDRFRCFHCKTELYGRLRELADQRGFEAVCSGANADDVRDWRPGLDAAADFGVSHPLLEAGLGKGDVRQLAQHLNVPSAQKPASPCLASRIPYGTPVDRATLAQIDHAEQAVRELGYRVMRVRHHGDLGKLEFAAHELEEAQRPQARAALEEAVRSAGYLYVEIDPQPFRSGSLNRLLQHVPDPDPDPEPG